MRIEELSSSVSRFMRQGRPAVSKETQDAYRDWGADVSRTTSWDAQLLAALNAACRVAAEDNWDGYGAHHVSYGTRSRALAFLDLLPRAFPMPTIHAEPDGEISFEWYWGPRRVLSVSVGDRYDVSYAGIFGASTAHGSEYFIDELPMGVIANLRRLYS